MIASRMHGVGFAMERGQTAPEFRRAIRPRHPVKTGKVMALSGKMQRERLLVCAKDMNAVTFSLRKSVVSFGPQGGRPQDQWRIKGD